MKSRELAEKPRQYKQSLRAQSAEATAQRIVDAFLARLINQWFDEITLDRVAEDAGVTVQTVVRRFGNKDGLLGEAVKTLSTQINARRQSPAGDIDCMIDNLIEDYEHTGDAVIRLLALEPRHEALKEVLNFGRSQHRSWVAGVFAEALAALDDADANRALDALVISSDVYTWKLLRRDMARSVPAAKTIMKSLVRGALNDPSISRPKGVGQ